MESASNLPGWGHRIDLQVLLLSNFIKLTNVKKYLPNIIIALLLSLPDPFFLLLIVLLGHGGTGGLIAGVVISLIIVFVIASVLHGSLLLFQHLGKNEVEQKQPLLKQMLITALITTGIWLLLGIFLVILSNIFPTFGRFFLDSAFSA